MIKNIIWDFDGTLFNTYPAIITAFKRVLGEFGIDVEDEEILAYLKISVTHAIKHFMSLYSLKNDFIERISFYEKNTDLSMVQPFPYAKEKCFDFKQNGGRNFILTHRGNSTLLLLKHYEMLDYFEEIVTKHHHFKPKPDPEGFNYLINKYNLPNDSILSIGDRECDILGAKQAKIITCLYDTNRIELTDNPDFTIKSLSELDNVLLSLN